MAIPILDIVGRLRTKADVIVNSKDIITQDGTSYTVSLTARPVASGSDEVYIQHTTFTTGLEQYVPRNGTQTALYASGLNLTYTINYDRGDLRFYRGSGTVIASTGLAPFAPWNTSNVIAYYQSSKYTDSLLGEYVSYAVAGVEMAIHIGMYISGISGVVPPFYRNNLDRINYKGVSPYGADEIFIIAEDLEIIQELVAQKAALDLATRERRLGAGNAIRIKDGDTEIDTSVNQRYLADFVKDIKAEYTDLIKWVIYNMGFGYNISQLNETYLRGGGDVLNEGAYKFPTGLY